MKTLRYFSVKSWDRGLLEKTREFLGRGVGKLFGGNFEISLFFHIFYSKFTYKSRVDWFLRTSMEPIWALLNSSFSFLWNKSLPISLNSYLAKLIDHLGMPMKLFWWRSESAGMLHRKASFVQMRKFKLRRLL